MKFDIQFTPKADLELTKAYNWYEEQKFGLGDDFVTEIDLVLNKICETPRHFPIKSLKQREALLKKFPFLIVFRIEEINKTIYIASIFHTKRNPTLK